MTLRDAIRSALRRGGPQGAWQEVADTPWTRVGSQGPGVQCNVCGWTGASFDGVAHCESSQCPQCGSIGRDRFLLYSLSVSVPYRKGLRLLETSPRMGDAYREAMARWFHYTASDFDERAHKASIQVDLQDIALPTASLDVLMTAHVLEHVPDTDRALAELHRVIAPGGWLILQIPLLQAATAPPTTPEFHGDNTPVFWRFGFDLTERLRKQGFEVELLCTDGFMELVHQGADRWPGESSPEFDADAIVAGAIAEDLRPVVSTAEAERLGLAPAYMYLTWAARRA